MTIDCKGINMSNIPDFNIPIWAEGDFIWDDLHTAYINLSDLIPSDGTTWAGCMWHSPIWRGQDDEGFIVEFIDNTRELFVRDINWSEWDPEYPDNIVDSWMYISVRHDGCSFIKIVIENDIRLSIQEIDDVCLNGMPSQPTENYRQVFKDEGDQYQNVS